MKDYIKSSHSIWECKYHTSIYSEISTEKDIREFAGIIERCVTSVDASKRVSDHRRAFDERSCAYIDIDSAQIFGVTYSWIFKG